MKYPCYCQLCNGQHRDLRTIQNHLGEEFQYPRNANEAPIQPAVVVQTGQHTFVCGPTADLNVFAGNIPDNGNELPGGLEPELGGGDPDNDMSDEPTHDPDLLEEEEKIRDFVLRTLLAKVHYGWSHAEAMQQIRNFFETVEDDRIPHKSWQSVIAFIKTLGYQEPKHYKVCCSEDHITLLEYDLPCPDCGKEWKNCSDYYVLGIHLEDIFLNEQSIKEHLCHWKEHEQWFNGKANDIPYKEIWHGQQFSDLSYFWDSDQETLLPTCCPNCGDVISTSEIEDATCNPGTDLRNLQCTECFCSFEHRQEYMKGCPLNQAYIFHEDGFNALVKKSRGMATIQISSACTEKKKRSQGKYLRVYSFIPSCKIGEGIPHKLDAFLKPLIDEVVDLYINGKTITLCNPVQVGDQVIEAGQHQVRMLLLLGTADIKAHAEMTLYAAGM